MIMLMRFPKVPCNGHNILIKIFYNNNSSSIYSSIFVSHCTYTTVDFIIR